MSLKLISLKIPHFSQHSTAKTNNKSTNLSRMASIGISVVLSASVDPEKTRLKKLMKITIIIMNKLQETTVFHGRQKLTSAMKPRLGK